MKRIAKTAVLPAALFSLLTPVAALADVTGTPTLNPGQELTMSTGAVGTSGGDLQWTGTQISFLSGAKAFILGPSSVAEYNSFGLAEAEGDASAMTADPVRPEVNVFFLMETGGGSFAKVLITAQPGMTITLEFDTFGAAAPVAPTISQVLNNYGLVPAGFSNSGIAPGALFIIKGQNLADPNAQTVLQDSTAAGGLPKTLNGASVSVTVGSTTVTPAFYYAISNQLALVLPSETPVGLATLTVTYSNLTSAAFSFNVVKSAFGFASASGSPGGQAHAQDLNYNYYSYSSSIPQGATIRLIGSGLGADSNLARDTQYVAQTATQINALSAVYVGGVLATIFYQGAEGYPGLDEVDVTIPANAPTGCFVSVVGVTAAGVPTNFLTLPIGSGACEDPIFGASGSTLENLSGQVSVSTGSVFLDESTGPAQSGTGTTTLDAALASFQMYNGYSYGSTTTNSVSIGGCTVQQTLDVTITQTPKGLDAGTITIQGPNGNATLASEGSVPGLAGLYEAQLSAGFIPASGGTFTVTGTGGNDVGPFTTQIVYPNPVLTWTNQTADASITRASGAQVNWNAGETGTFVIISGSATSPTSHGSFTCIEPVSPPTFTVPSYVLEALPAAGGTLDVANYTTYNTFTATGINTGVALGFVNYQINATYQ